MLTRLVIAAADPPGSNGPATRKVPALSPEGRRSLVAEFPTVEIALYDRGEVRVVTADAGEWDEPDFDCAALGARMAEIDSAGDFGVEIVTPFSEVARVSHEVLTRYQRFVGRRNRWSRVEAFDRALALRAGDDREGSLDTWQWLLRLDPAASLAAQVAALLRGAPALAGGTQVALVEVGFDAGTAERAQHLVDLRDRPAGDGEAELLDEAAAFSFLSLRSAGHLAAHGGEAARRKVTQEMARIRPTSLGRLRAIRYCAEIEAVILAELAVRGSMIPGAAADDDVERGYPTTVRMTREGARI